MSADELREHLEAVVACVKGLALSSAVCLAVWVVIASQPVLSFVR